MLPRSCARSARLFTAGLVVLVTAACGSSPDLSTPVDRATIVDATTACGRVAEAPHAYDHVVVLVEENRSWSGGRSPAIGMGFSSDDMPYLRGLASRCAYYRDWVETDTSEKSLNQYVGLTAGVVDRSITDDCEPSDSCRSLDDNIFRQVRESGGTSRTYVDGASEPCSAGETNRARHIPALYFHGGDDLSFCDEEVRPLAQLDPDHLPTFAFVVPDVCHDGHDCGDKVVDDFARTTIEPILRSDTYAAGKTMVIVIYDEDQAVPNLLIAPSARQGPIDEIGSHARLLRTLDEALDLPVLQQAGLGDTTSLRASANI